MRNVGLIELLEPADPAETGLGDLAEPGLAAGPGRPPAGPEPEPGTETGP